MPPLLPALAYVTGDLSLLRDDLRPDPTLMALPQGGLSAAQLATAREHRARRPSSASATAGAGPRPRRRRAVLLRIMEHVVGGADMEEYLPLLEEELALRGDDRRAPRWRKADVAPDVELPRRDHRRGHVRPAHRTPARPGGDRLRGAGEERRRRWHLVREPVSRLSGRQPQPQLQLLVRATARLAASLLHPGRAARTTSATCAREFGLDERIRFGTEVRSATWDDTDGSWTLVTRTDDGAEDTARRARGRERGRPAQPAELPRHPGSRPLRRRRRSTRPRWDDDVPLDGARIAVIGTGASSVQFTPEIAPRAGHLFLFQRTPPWMGPTADYHDPVLRRAAVALRARPDVQRVEPVLDVLAHGRRRAPGRAGRSRVGHRERLRQRDQRLHAHDARVVPRAAVRRPARPPAPRGPDLPARRQAAPPRQRRLGERR